MTEEFWKKFAGFMVKISKIPFPISKNLIDFLQAKITEEQAKLLLEFKKHSMSFEQIKKKSELTADELGAMLNELMDNGIIAGFPDEKTGSLKYTLMALFPGIIEYAFAGGKTGAHEENLAHLVENMIGDLREVFLNNYDIIMPQLKSFPAFERIIPVEESIPVGQQVVLTTENAFKIVDETDDLAIVHCYCKQEKDLTKDPCKITDKRDICINLGETANFAINHNFGTRIAKKEAKDILREAEKLGLVHKIFKSNLQFGRTIDGICSCCKCCCGMFRYHHEGTWPYMTLTSYIANLDKSICNGCEDCVERCPMNNISMKNDVAVLDKKCIGCGLCAYICKPKAIQLVRTGERNVFIPVQRV